MRREALRCCSRQVLLCEELTEEELVLWRQTVQERLRELQCEQDY